MIKQSMIQDKIDMKVEYIDHICINDIEKWFLGFLFILSHGPFKCSLTYQKVLSTKVFFRKIHILNISIFLYNYACKNLMSSNPFRNFHQLNLLQVLSARSFLKAFFNTYSLCLQSIVYDYFCACEITNVMVQFLLLNNQFLWLLYYFT